MIIIRKADIRDRENILNLYKDVAQKGGGIARNADEITDDYIENFMRNALNKGIELVAIDEANDKKIIAEIHCYKLQPKVFDHVLSELTIVVSPVEQGRGVGKKIFCALLQEIENNHTDILRVELIARESNDKAINFYKSIGFVQEGRFEKRIHDDGFYEADIPMAWFNKNFKN